MDAVNGALVRFDAELCRLVHFLKNPVTPELRAGLRAMQAGSPLIDMLRLDHRLGLLFADTALRLISEAGMDKREIRAIGSHGQTIWHAPMDRAPHTLQIGDPNLIAWRTGIVTIADFRRMDMAAGGQGAPLAPAFHAQVFRDPGHDRAIVNIGGIANLSLIPGDPQASVSGFDTGPGNALLDDWAARHLRTPYDVDGAWAASGQVHDDLLSRLLADRYFAARPPKSTGREYFNLRWLDQYLAPITPTPGAADVQATLVELTARSIARAVKNAAPAARQVLVCGGGAHNRTLMTRLKRALAGWEVLSTGQIGVDPEAVEAMCFAWLAKRRLEGQPGNLPAVTGAAEPVVLGGIYEPRPRADSD